jgi:hypothetical protein
MAGQWHSADDQLQERRRQQRSLLFNQQLSSLAVTRIFLLQAWREKRAERYLLALLLALLAGALLLF